MDITKQGTPKVLVAPGKQRNYNEIVEYLDKGWSIARHKSFERMKQLDKLLQFPSQKIPVLIIGGSNGKSLTAHLTAKLLKNEGLKAGVFLSPHLLSYNERFVINYEAISNKNFVELANEVINLVEHHKIVAHTSELLTAMMLRFCIEQKVDVAVFEARDGAHDPINICNAKVVAITRIIPTDSSSVGEETLRTHIKDVMGLVKQNSWVISGDQTKAHLIYMHELTVAQGGSWAMPIRKLATLAYPYEQLHGRCAALAERIAQIFIEKFASKDVLSSDSLLNKQKGQRGRPTLEAKRLLEQNPKKTLEQFWREQGSDLPGRFQILDKDKPSVLLDMASNLDALKNVLLGIRLVHYKRTVKGFALIMSCAQDSMDYQEYLKLMRYFFKKTSGTLFVCPLVSPLRGVHEENSWDAEKVAIDLKGLKLKVRAASDFEEAFDLAKKSVDERNGLIAITGSRSLIQTYWHYKGIKKF